MGFSGWVLVVGFRLFVCKLARKLRRLCVAWEEGVTAAEMERERARESEREMRAHARAHARRARARAHTHTHTHTHTHR